MHQTLKSKEDGILEKYNLQEHYCFFHDLPILIYQTGVCFFCGRNYLDCLTLEECSRHHITSCGLCGMSFCD